MEEYGPQIGVGVTEAPVIKYTRNGDDYAMRMTGIPKAIYRQSGEHKFVKSLQAKTPHERQEIFDTYHLSIPLGTVTRDDEVRVIYPLCETDLLKHLGDKKWGSEHMTPITSIEIVQFLKDTSIAVDFMHMHGYQHQDLFKLDNYLLKDGRFYVCDFHLTIQAEDDQLRFPDRELYARAIDELLVYNADVDIEDVLGYDDEPWVSGYDNIHEYKSGVVRKVYGEEVYGMILDFRTGDQSFQEFAEKLGTLIELFVGIW